VRCVAGRPSLLCAFDYINGGGALLLMVASRTDRLCAVVGPIVPLFANNAY
jgi:hypothetical protein